MVSVSLFFKGRDDWAAERVDMCFHEFLRGKVSKRAENAYQTPKLRAVGRESPPPPLSLKKGERKRLVLLAAGPATACGTFSWVFSHLVYTDSDMSPFDF